MVVSTESWSREETKYRLVVKTIATDMNKWWILEHIAFVSESNAPYKLYYTHIIMFFLKILYFLVCSRLLTRTMLRFVLNGIARGGGGEIGLSQWHVPVFYHVNLRVTKANSEITINRPPKLLKQGPLMTPLHRKT